MLIVPTIETTHQFVQFLHTLGPTHDYRLRSRSTADKVAVLIFDGGPGYSHVERQDADAQQACPARWGETHSRRCNAEQREDEDSLETGKISTEA